MTEADVTCVVCRSPDTVGPSKLYCGDCEPVGHRDERPDPVAVQAEIDRSEYFGVWSGGVWSESTPSVWIFDKTQDGWIDVTGDVDTVTWTVQWPC